MKGPLSLLLAALSLRLLPWPAVFRGGRVLFVDMDDYYHARRVMTALMNFPALPSFDWYLGYPRGFHCFWPPLHDLLLALLSILTGGRVDMVAALAPPFLGTLTLALFYRLAAKGFGRSVGLLALALAALSPMMIQYSLVGRPDHHCAEALWFLAALLLLDKDREVPAGFCLALGLQTWIGFIVFDQILFAHMLWVRRPRHRLFFIQVPLLLALTCANGWVSSGAFDFDAPSLFQPALLAVLGLFALAARRGKFAPYCVGAGGLLLGVLALKSTESFALFSAGIPRLFSEVAEMRPYWSDPAQVVAQFGRFFFLIPVFAVVCAREDKRPAVRLWVTWLIGTGVLMLLQTRYAMHFSLPAALFMAWGVVRIWPKTMVARALFAGAALWCLVPQLKNSAALWLDRKAVTVDPQLVEACEWIRRNTPPTRSLWKDEGRPEYGVYSDAVFGNAVAYVAQRPAAASLMHTLREPIVDSTLFFFMTDASKAREFLAAKGMRYILLSDILSDGLHAMYARIYGVPGYPASVPGLIYTRLFFSTRGVEGFKLVYTSSRYKVFELTGGGSSGTAIPGSGRGKTPRGRSPGE